MKMLTIKKWFQLLQFVSATHFTSVHTPIFFSKLTSPKMRNTILILLRLKHFIQTRKYLGESNSLEKYYINDANTPCDFKSLGIRFFPTNHTAAQQLNDTIFFHHVRLKPDEVITTKSIHKHLINTK
jgi:hypothetical protein